VKRSPRQLLSPARRQWVRSGTGLSAVALTAASSTVRARPPSPAVTPFVHPLPIPPILPERSLSDPGWALAPTVQPRRTINPLTRLPFEGRGDPHQWREQQPPQHFFIQRFGVVPPKSIHPNLPLQTHLWGANLGGADVRQDPPVTPLPTIVSRSIAGRNTAILVRRFNQLPSGAPSGGFGKNSLSTHLHNFHSAPDSDGGPCDPSLGALSEDPLTQGRFFFPGQYYDYYYNMKRAGFSQPSTPDGDVRESLGTLWYHDHREAHTAENTYKGLAGFHLVFNEYDTGDETTGFRLPSFPAYDIPIALGDILIDPVSGQLTMQDVEDDGLLGDLYTANGAVQPFFEVRRRRYRLRLLNRGPSRHQVLCFSLPDRPGSTVTVWRISNDGNFYEAPLRVDRIKLAPGERADVIIDFARLTARGGQAEGLNRIWIENLQIQDNPRKPDDELRRPGQIAHAMVEIRIGASAPDSSADPETIRSFAPILLPVLGTPAVTREFKWERKNGLWACNGKLLDCNEIRFSMKRGRWERWIHRGAGGWAHPIHNHFVEGRIIRRNGVIIRPGSQEYVRKDVLALYPGDELEFWVQPTDYLGVYPLHCHNTLHEDYGMMLLFRVDDVGDNKTAP
jgi:FtsP/CotA-like multicopper oxidase with cupredoxin domain